MSIDWEAKNVPAILDAHYPGELGGDAIANTLYGTGSETPILLLPCLRQPPSPCRAQGRTSTPSDSERQRHRETASDSE